MAKTLNILQDLISLPSYVDNNSDESLVIDYIIKYFKNLKNGYVVEEQLVEGKRKNIVIIKNSKPKVILFGHMDTVLPNADAKKPFLPKIIGNKIYGLGAADMKSGLAIMLSIASRGDIKDVGYIFTVDEEYDFKGALKLIQKYHFQPDLIINLEPTNLEVLNGCRGVTEFSFDVIGRSAHAGRKYLGINAIEKSIELVKIFEDNLKKFDTASMSSSVNLAYLHGGMLQERSKDGNHKISDKGVVVPNYAKLNCEIRLASQKISENYIKKSLTLIGNSLGIKVENLKFKFYLGTMLTVSSKLKEFEKAIRDAGVKVKYRNINEAGFYEVQMLNQKWKSDCLAIGAGPAEKSHTIDEYCNISDIEKVEEIVLNYLLRR